MRASRILASLCELAHTENQIRRWLVSIPHLNLNLTLSRHLHLHSDSDSHSITVLLGRAVDPNKDQKLHKNSITWSAVSGFGMGAHVPDYHYKWMVMLSMRGCHNVDSSENYHNYLCWRVGGGREVHKSPSQFKAPDRTWPLPLTSEPLPSIVALRLASVYLYLIDVRSNACLAEEQLESGASWEDVDSRDSR